MEPLFKILRAFQSGVLRITDAAYRGFAYFGLRILVAAGGGFLSLSIPGFITGKWHPTIATCVCIGTVIVLLCVLFRPAKSSPEEKIRHEIGRMSSKRTDRE